MPTGSRSSSAFGTRLKSVYSRSRTLVYKFLSSHAQHYTVLVLVSCDLLAIFADIIINLYQCDNLEMSHGLDHRLQHARDSLAIVGLVFSCIFLLELMLSFWIFGFRYFKSWFRSFDAAVIVASFVIDVVLRGVLGEVASLVIILRFWRFFKIIEEFSLASKENAEELEARIHELEIKNEKLKEEIKKQRGTVDEENSIGFQSGSVQRS
ncbi:Uncharacterized protein BP5553_05337 [Venustampulla echinocandica]|uniref:Voltage-gated hydrogen channel 1 n=1 Tax=Venustampulla echinocandica TaxID=2656787 RepID=A0A370TQW2_9HELO|nr:Uncharacterized protein BP5553_05337 [Venustampulla echinocandica]RDL37904.1 Uncharacterized protein BP5553_05337 [Venustampulla echinocandica]